MAPNKKKIKDYPNWITFNKVKGNTEKSLSDFLSPFRDDDLSTEVSLSNKQLSVHKYPPVRYGTGGKLPETWVNSIIIQGNKIFKIQKIENNWINLDYYCYVYVELVDDPCFNLALETEKQTKEEILVFSDRLEDRGELELATNLRENVRDRGILVII